MANKRVKPVRSKSKPTKSKAKKPSKRARQRPAKDTPRKSLKGRLKVNKAKAGKRSEIALKKIGVVTHYFSHVNAAAVKLLKGGITIGDNIYLKGHTTDFKEQVRSIQLDHQPIAEGKKGQEIGLFVKSRVRMGDSVYRI